MKTFLILFSSWPSESQAGAALIDYDIDDRLLASLVEENGGDPACKHCRGRVVAEAIRDRAYELKAAPAGYLQATVHDVSADLRVRKEHKYRLLQWDGFVDEIASEIGASGALH